jgi:hypothetical protein
MGAFVQTIYDSVSVKPTSVRIKLYKALVPLFPFYSNTILWIIILV